MCHRLNTFDPSRVLGPRNRDVCVDAAGSVSWQFITLLCHYSTYTLLKFIASLNLFSSSGERKIDVTSMTKLCGGVAPTSTGHTIEALFVHRPSAEQMSNQIDHETGKVTDSLRVWICVSSRSPDPSACQRALRVFRAPSQGASAARNFGMIPRLLRACGIYKHPE